MELKRTIEYIYEVMIHSYSDHRSLSFPVTMLQDFMVYRWAGRAEYCTEACPADQDPTILFVQSCSQALVLTTIVSEINE